MLISTLTDEVGGRISDQESVRMIAEAGFDAIDYSMFRMQNDDNILNTPDYMSHILELKEMAESYDKFFNQAHAPFPTLRDGDEEYNAKIFPRVKRAIEIAGVLGCHAIIVHPVVFAEDMFEKNIKMYNELAPVAREFGVKIALENMWGWSNELNRIVPNICSTGEDFVRYLDALDSEVFTACLDLGHSGLVGDDAARMVRVLGHDRLTCLHVHDNDGVHDSHFPPYTMSMKWHKIAKALKEIEYTGIVTLEADAFLKKAPSSALVAGVAFLKAVARAFADEIES